MRNKGFGTIQRAEHQQRRLQVRTGQYSSAPELTHQIKIHIMGMAAAARSRQHILSGQAEQLVLLAFHHQL